jgi:hypothetical protein
MQTSDGKILSIEDFTADISGVKKDWTAVVIHHSETPDGKLLSDFDAIKRFHTSYRFKGDIITADKARELSEKGVTITRPWQDIGYNYVVEYVNNILVIRRGRSLEIPGAHCVGMNNKAVGICLVGNYDVSEPVDEQYNILAEMSAALIKRWHIPLENFKPHHYYAAWKTCPGLKFNWTKYSVKVINSLK